MIDSTKALNEKIGQRAISPFDKYLHNDLALIIVLLLIEFAKDDRNVVYFSEFFKFLKKSRFIDFDKFEDVDEYTKVYEFIMKIISELDFVKIDKIYFEGSDEESCLKKLLKSFIEEYSGIVVPEQSKWFLDDFESLLNFYFKLKSSATVLKWQSDRFEYFGIEGFYGECLEVNFNPNEADYFGELLFFSGESAVMSFAFDKKKALSFEKALNDFIVKSFKDYYGDDDEIFVEQSLADFQFRNGAIKIPCELINNDNFSLIWILKYLDVTRQIAVKEWSVPDKFWEARLLKKDLLSVFVPNPEVFLSTPVSERIRISLDSKSKIVIVNDVVVDLKKADFQFDLLEVLLKEKPIDFDLSFPEVAESIDHSYESLGKENQAKLRKRYSNAAFQLSRKIGFEAGIKDILVIMKNGVRFNSKHKFKFIVR